MASELIESETPAPFEKERQPSHQVASRRPSASFLVATGYVIFCAGIVALLPFPSGQTSLRIVMVAAIAGIVLGQSTCASIWMSLGTGSRRTRTNLGLAWMSLLVAGLAVRLGQMGQPLVSIGAIAVVIAAALMVQAGLIRFLLWITRVCFGIELTPPTAANPDAVDVRQFGIVQLMAFTAILAVALAAGRALVQWLAESDVISRSPLPLYLFIATATILVTLPIAVASLLDRHVFFAMAIAALLICGVTAMELPTLAAAKLAYGNDLNFPTLTSINVATSLIVLAYTLGLRFVGFRLTMGKTPPTWPTSRQAN